jgi:hypothetical protein
MEPSGASPIEFGVGRFANVSQRVPSKREIPRSEHAPAAL